MKIKRISYNGPSAVILGAGATCGASFAKNLAGAHPPLDNDFFTQAQRLSSNKPHALVEQMIQNAVRVFGSNFKLTMEGYLTQLEYLSNVFEDYRLKGRPADNPYPKMRQNFLQVLAALLDESIGKTPDCIYHNNLVSNLDATDTIMSFNYDWLIDQTLREKALEKWNPRIGYGVDSYSVGNKAQGTNYWACRDPKTGKESFPKKTIHLLKMHGSMNWFPIAADQKHVRLHLRQRWWHQMGNLSFEIVPPEWNKPLRAGIYKIVWQKARSTLRTVRSVVVIGYSLPSADLPAQALLMVDATEQRQAPKLNLLVLVNPDQVARARIRGILRNRIDGSTRVLTFDYFKDFSRFLD